MKTRLNPGSGLAGLALAIVLALPLATRAQTPVDDEGKTLGDYESAVMTASELEELVGPIALYPDDLLAIVLPASAYPLQIVSAARFLDDLAGDASLKPDPSWDDSVVALLNYPEVIKLMNDDIDWTWRLGEAVVSQQADVIEAIEAFRDRAYAAGNLKSDEHQHVARDDGVIEISPVEDDVIYVPYYEPERVVVYQPRPVYYYYPRSYPVYYYPYPAAYDFDYGFFWGVTTAFTIGWYSDSLHVYHHSYRGHPYFGHRYRDRWWYRRPTINVYNTHYLRDRQVTINHYYNGDSWHPRRDRRHYDRHQRVTTNRYYNGHRTVTSSRAHTVRRDEPISFRDRGTTGRSNPGHQQRDRRTVTTAPNRRDLATRRGTQRHEPARETRQAPIQFRERSSATRNTPTRRTTTTPQQRRDPVVRRQSQAHTSAPQARLQRREPVVRPAPPARAPVRQARPQQAAPRRAVPHTQTRRESPPPQRQQARREASPPPQKHAPSRRSESRARPERHNTRRSRR